MQSSWRKLKQRGARLCASDIRGSPDRGPALDPQWQTCMIEGPEAIRLPLPLQISNLSPLHTSPFQPSNYRHQHPLSPGEAIRLGRMQWRPVSLVQIHADCGCEFASYLATSLSRQSSSGWFCFEDVSSSHDIQAGEGMYSTKESQDLLISRAAPLSSTSQPLLWVRSWQLAVINPAQPRALLTGVDIGWFWHHLCLTSDSDLGGGMPVG